LIVKGFSNPYWGAFAFIYLPLSFAVWQGALVLLYFSGRSAVSKQLRTVTSLLGSYVASAAAAIALFWVFPARFY
jgi:hypothetical protein